MHLPEHISLIDSNLYDKSVAGWHRLPALREKYAYAFSRIKTVAQLKASLRVPYAWPGGYELAILLADSGLLCNTCARAEFRQLVWDIVNKCNTGWRPEGTVCMADIDGPCPCSHCGRELSPFVDDNETETA